MHYYVCFKEEKDSKTVVEIVWGLLFFCLEKKTNYFVRAIKKKKIEME